MIATTPSHAAASFTLLWQHPSPAQCLCPQSGAYISLRAAALCRYEIAAENKRLSEPLARALKEVEGLRAALASADKDKASLSQTKARLATAEKQVGPCWQLGVAQCLGLPLHKQRRVCPRGLCRALLGSSCKEWCPMMLLLLLHGVPAGQEPGVGG
jgi:hypothetical protein